jgi:hypothetical protein
MISKRGSKSTAEQYKRFKEAAKEADVTESEEEFERVFKKVAPQRPKKARKAE